MASALCGPLTTGLPFQPRISDSERVIRIAVDMFLEEPDVALLDGAMVGPYALFRDHASGLFLLCAGVEPDGRPDLSDDYLGSVEGKRVPLPIARDHPDRRRGLLPVDPARNAVALSRALGQTVVSVYSTDDEYDAAAVAEDGQLSHLFWQSDQPSDAPVSDEDPLPILHHDIARGLTLAVISTEDTPRYMFAAAECAVRQGFGTDVDLWAMSGPLPREAEIVAHAERLGIAVESAGRAYGDFELLHHAGPAEPGPVWKTANTVAAYLAFLALPLVAIWTGRRSLSDKLVYTFILLFIVSLALHLLVAAAATLLRLEVPDWAKG